MTFPPIDGAVVTLARCLNNAHWAKLMTKSASDFRLWILDFRTKSFTNCIRHGITMLATYWMRKTWQFNNKNHAIMLEFVRFCVLKSIFRPVMPCLMHSVKDLVLKSKIQSLKSEALFAISLDHCAANIGQHYVS